MPRTTDVDSAIISQDSVTICHFLSHSVCEMTLCRTAGISEDDMLSGYKKRRSVPPHGPMWLVKATLLLLHAIQLQPHPVGFG